MKIVAIIPARFGAARLPGKPLLDLEGKPLIQHTYERTSQARNISRVIVATDDARISEAVRAFGGEVVMTSSEHPTGTDRIAEVARRLDCDYVVNVQGDEALIDPRMIEQVIEATTAREGVVMGTAARPIRELRRFRDPMVVKVVVSSQGFALYFSRSPIPFVRDASQEELASPDVLRHFLEHIGLYVYRRDFLLQFIRMPQTPLEKMEKLEQLRALENGYKIAVVQTEYFAFGIDTPEDLEEARRMSNAQKGRDQGAGAVISDPRPLRIVRKGVVLSTSYEGPKFIVVSGGVMSGVGKGLATSSIGKILQQYGYSTTAIKIDPYINYDAGTLRPTEHGEVWVTDDGGEIDQDLGNYERFLGIPLSRWNNLTTGQIYKTVIERERSGEYLGKTVQPIPHVTDEIKRRIGLCAEGFDMVLVEVGGTVGDYENEIFLYALKSIERDIGEENMLYVLVTYLPILRHLGEMKTKPTQQAIRLLGENGIFPDFILCRGTQPLDDIRKKKIEVSANIGADYIISNPDVQTLYSIPLDLEAEGMGKKLLDKFGLEPKQSPDWTHWEKLVHTIEHPRKTVKIAMVGKYVESGDFSFSDSYVSINQSLEHAGAALGVRVAISWIDAKGLEQDASEIEKLSEYDGVLIPGAFGGTGAEGMLLAVKYAREHHVPYLGLCYGLHMAVVEFARNVCGMEGANSSEIDPKTKYPVIDFQPEQRERIKRKEYGGSMRLGAYSAILKAGSQVLKLYKKSGRLKEDADRIAELKKDPENASHLGLLPPEGNIVLERHRHRYEVAPEFVETLERKGLVFSGYHLTSRGSKLMEFLELPGHPYFTATQAHPEFKSRLEKPAPLFYGFIEAALKK